jgi:hypothetical protein
VLCVHAAGGVAIAANLLALVLIAPVTTAAVAAARRADRAGRGTRRPHT